MKYILGLLTGVAAVAPPASFDCAFRQFALEYAASLQPWRGKAFADATADALNGAIEAQNCSVSLPSQPASRFSYLPLPAPGTPNVYFIDAVNGVDSSPGTISLPFRTLARGLAATRAAAGTPGTLVLRGGTFYLPAPLVLTPEDSHLTIQGYPGEEAWLSGGLPLTGLTWGAYNTTPAPTWHGPFVGVSDVHAAEPGPHLKIIPSTPSAAACQGLC